MRARNTWDTVRSRAKFKTECLSNQAFRYIKFMKKIYLLILLLALITLVACGISENNISYVDSVFYKHNSTIYYYDYLSDESKPLCARKGCTHDKQECDFFEVIKIIDSDNYVYFLSDKGFEIQDGETTLKQTISVFNKLDNTTQSLYTVNAFQNNCINFHMEIYEE